MHRVSDTTAHDRTDRDVRRAADRMLVRVARHGGVWVVVLALASLTTAGARLALPALIGRAVDAIVEGGPTATWVIWCAVVVTLMVVSDALDDLAAGAAIARSTAWMRHSTLRHFLALGTRPARRLPSGEVTTRLVGNAAEAGRVTPDVVRSLAGMVPAVGGIVALALIHPWLCLTFLAGMPALLLLVRSYARDASDVVARYFEVQGTIAARLVDALTGARTIAAAATADREAARVLAPLPDLHRHGVDTWRAQMRISTQDAVIVSLLEVAVLAVAGALLVRGQISAGQMLAASGYVLLAGSVGSVVTGMTTLVRSRASATCSPSRRCATARPPPRQDPAGSSSAASSPWPATGRSSTASTSPYRRARSSRSSAPAVPANRCWPRSRGGSSTPTRARSCSTAWRCPS
jgi:ATP-binding cassette subfamily B protein